MAQGVYQTFLKLLLVDSCEVPLALNFFVGKPVAYLVGKEAQLQSATLDNTLRDSSMLAYG